MNHDDLLIFATGAAEKSVTDAIMVAVASDQPDLHFNLKRKPGLLKRALTIFQDWGTPIRQVLLWSSTPALEQNFPAPNEAIQGTSRWLIAWLKIAACWLRFMVVDATAFPSFMSGRPIVMIIVSVFLI